MENHEQQRIRAAQLMQSRAGLNGYTQGSKRKYFWGYPDNLCNCLVRGRGGMAWCFYLTTLRFSLHSPLLPMYCNATVFQQICGRFFCVHMV